MNVVHSRPDFLAARARLSGEIGLVPTMGALHAGHGALLSTARAETHSVVATIFVNPLQFGPSEDLARYPRTLDADLARLEQWGADLVWAPGVEDVYAAGPVGVTVAPGPLGDELEGAVRPGHFAGVLTVVAKFFNLVRPDRAYFGEKDYQQLTLTRRMVADLDLGVRVVGVPTVREPDGLALSSRNVYLSPDERTQALGLSRALMAGAAAAGALEGTADGTTDGAADQPTEQRVLDAAREVLAEHQIGPDYLELRGADLGPVRVDSPSRLLVAARIGTTRLIDNVGVHW